MIGRRSWALGSKKRGSPPSPPPGWRESTEKNLLLVFLPDLAQTRWGPLREDQEADEHCPRNCGLPVTGAPSRVTGEHIRLPFPRSGPDWGHGTSTSQAWGTVHLPSTSHPPGTALPLPTLSLSSPLSLFLLQGYRNAQRLTGSRSHRNLVAEARPEDGQVLFLQITC